MAKNLTNLAPYTGSSKLDNPYYHNPKILKKNSPRKWCWHWKGWYLQITIFQIYLTLRTVKETVRERAHCKHFLFTMFNANNVSVFWHLARHLRVSLSFLQIRLVHKNLCFASLDLGLLRLRPCENYLVDISALLKAFLE